MHSSTDSSNSSSSNSDEEFFHRCTQRRVIHRMIQHVVQNQIPQTLQSRSRTFIERNREMGYTQLYNDYFSENPIYPDNIFRRRFRMRKGVFLRIVDACKRYDQFFQPRRDATGRLSISALQKCTAAIRMLAYGEAADAVDEYLRMSETTSRKSLLKFTEAVIANFGSQYLRKPTEEDLQRLLQLGEQRGFPGMIGSIDCMHWEWKNCPAAWRGMYQGRSGVATLVLEAVASQDLWIWHSFFGIPGSCNDITVVHRSPVFDDILECRAPSVNFVVNGNQYDLAYYLADGIYPQWATFIQPIHLPINDKDSKFSELQEAARKDIERAFGVLQSRFAIIRRPSLAWDTSILGKIITSCIIMHNMIVEDERDTYLNYDDTSEFDADLPQRRQFTTDAEDATSFEVHRSENLPQDIRQYLNNRHRVCDKIRHRLLKSDLVEHIWQRFQRTRS